MLLFCDLLHQDLYALHFFHASSLVGQDWQEIISTGVQLTYIPIQGEQMNMLIVVIILPCDYCRSCYWLSLELCRQNDLRTLAFPCISTGAYHYPSVEAADVAIATVRAWLLSNPMNLESVDRVVFVTRRLCDEECYATLMLTYFPLV